MKGMTLHEVKGFFMGVAKEENTIFAKAKSTKKTTVFQASLRRWFHFLLGFQPLYFTLAEGKGFEPLVPFSTTVFKTAAIDHSAIPPIFVFCDSGRYWCFFLKNGLQRYHFFSFLQIWSRFFV